MSTMTIVWLIFAVVMGIIEACTVQLVSIWFAVGGAAACITSLFTDSLVIQIIVFVAVSAIALAVTRPLVKRLKKKKAEATNADRFIGKKAVVLTAINNDLAQGMVQVDHEKWTARSDNGEPIPKGATVIVTAIEGVKLIVKTT